VKIALVQLNYHIGNFESNASRIKENIRKARAEGADLAVFAELSVCGYPPRDFLEFSDFIDRCHAAAVDIAATCQGIAAIIGCPVPNPSEKGKSLFNAALFLHEGKIISAHHKALLPNYDVFDEYRYFEPAREFSVIGFKGERIAVTVCEDLWNIVGDPLYVMDPMDELKKERPGIMINIAASPFHYNQAATRTEVFRQNVERYGIPLLYVNHVGAQTELLFDGGSMAMDAMGNIRHQLEYFREDFRIVDTGSLSAQAEKGMSVPVPGRIELIHDALVMGVGDYFGKMGFGQAILGLSGGIDSAVTAVIASRALGPENVWAVLMPSGFSSAHSITDAVALAENLGCRYDVVPIDHSFQSVLKTLEPRFGELPFDITEENIQARLRGVILMALSNKFGHILLNTSNKSEAAVGYGTLYGDMNGGLSVLGDVYKTEIYELAEFINKETEVIPLNTIRKPPSAELRPGQKDSDSLPDYEVLDRILFGYIELRKGPLDLVREGFDEHLVNRILKMVNTSEYKRYQTPPILRISPKAFGMGRRMPIVARYLA
jgi:NAD+ synthase (glutamine-hydrolysing)